MTRSLADAIQRLVDAHLETKIPRGQQERMFFRELQRLLDRKPK